MRWMALIAVLVVCCSPCSAADEGEVVGIPAKPASGLGKKEGGVAWYRCYAKVPDIWIPPGRPLWSESVTITVGPIADAYELFINGRKIESLGSFPPKFKAATGNVNRIKVPPGSLLKGKYNAIAIRLYNAKGGTAMRGDATPVLAGYFLESKLDQWLYYKSDDAKLAGVPLSAKPRAAGFDRFTEANTALRRPDILRGGPKLSPADSLKTMKVADDLVLEQVLTEPLIAQPLDMTFDERGRLWVVQYRQYPYPAGLKQISRDKYYRAVYDKVPAAPPNHSRGADRVTIHEDTNNDGTFDKHSVFVDGLNMASSVAVGRNGVFILNPPYLLYYPDSNRDDKPDGDPQVLLEGFGLEDTHSVVNSLTWGPDGWLYFADGSTTASQVKRPGTKDEPIYLEGPGVWRYHPESKRYELFAEGGGNAFDLEFDAKGNVYTGHNGGNTRGFHYHQGGHYLRGGSNKYGPRANPYTFGHLPEMKTERPISRFTHATVLYESGGLPQRYQDHWFCADPLHRNIVLAKHMPHGSTFQTADQGFPLAGNDPAFRPVAIDVGPDGAIYVADFYEYYIAHGQHFQGQIDPNTGRIYRLRGKDTKPTKLGDLRNESTADLIERLSDPNKRIRQLAQRVLADRKDKQATPALQRMLSHDNGQTALEGLWALHTGGGFNDMAVGLAGIHADPNLRRWMVRLIGDLSKPTPLMIHSITELAKLERDPIVRTQLAATSKRLPPNEGIVLIDHLLNGGNEANDPHLPLMLWFAIEARCKTHADAVMDLFKNKERWANKLVADHLLERVMRRFASTGSRNDLKRCAKLLEWAPSKANRATLMKGFELAYKGRSLTNLPNELTQQLAAQGGANLMLRVRLADKAAIEEAIKKVSNLKAPVEERLTLLRTFGEVATETAVPALLALAKSKQADELRIAAINALSNFDKATIGEIIAGTYASLPPTVQTTARTMLSSRAAWSTALLKLVDAGKTDNTSFEPDVIAKLKLHKDASLAALVKKHFPNQNAASPADTRKEIAKLKAIIVGANKSVAKADAPAGNPYVGRKHFLQRCGACHTLYSEGGRIGPDLTPYQRDDLNTMLMSIVDPSAEIREGFENMLVETKDERQVSGFFVDRDEHVLVLRGLDGQNVTIKQSNVASIKSMGRSLMPAGMLAGMDDQAIRDLFAYLRSAQPIAR